MASYGLTSRSARLLNDNPDAVTNQAAQDFVDLIQQERTRGYGFVPFIGAGFSAPSGVPIVKELKPYLQRCICMALGAEADDERDEIQPWNPRTDQWPPFIDRARQELDPLYWSNRLFNHLSNRNHKRDADEAELAIIAEGFGAAAEWRTALLFLSRISRPLPRSIPPPKAFLTAPQQEIVDSCFREVLKEKYPALGHTMLAVLAGALRLDLILTTNFDDLLELAFASARNPLDVFDVQIDGTLPHWSALSDVRSLIKLHGSRSSLRVNYTLDGPPSEPDKQRFLEYLLSGLGKSKFEAEKPDKRNRLTELDFQNHLLMMGFSASEIRTKALVEYALTHLHRDFKVFWICYSSEDVQVVQDLTEDAVRGNDRSIILRHPHAGHVLLQLYQTIRRNLPPIGSLFPSVSRLTLPPLESSYVSENLTNEPPVKWTTFCKAIGDRIKDFAVAPKQLKLLIACSEGDARGVTSACAQVFREIEAENICLWLDMNDISSADNLFEVLLEAAYFRLGSENWTPVYLGRDAAPRAAEIRRLANSVNKKWVIFLNARESPGANTDDSADGERPHGWLDDTTSLSKLSDASNNVEAFKTLVKALCGAESERISVVLLCRNPGPRMPVLLRAWEPDLKKHLLQLGPQGKPWFTEDAVVKRALEWTQKDDRKRRFLHALCLMQRPRLLATIWSPAVSLPFDPFERQPNERLKWVTELEQSGLVRRKAGGFIWLHSRCRGRLRKILGESRELAGYINQSPEMRDYFEQWYPDEQGEEIHAGLAEWYEKILDSSEAPAAVFETIHHLCMAAHISLTKPLPAKEVAMSACKRIDAASALLEVNSFLIQTHGYSRGSCRRLEYIRDNLCGWINKKSKEAPLADVEVDGRNPVAAASQRLQLVCTEVMRAIAREVGEDSKAYARHRQFAFFHAQGEWSAEYEEGLCKPNKEKHAIAKMLFESLKQQNRDEPAEGLCDPQWPRWWRWNGTLAIGSRCYEGAKSALRNALQCMDGGEKYPKLDSNAEWTCLVQNAVAAIDNMPPASSAKLRVEALRVIEQYVALGLLEDSVAHRLAFLDNSFGSPVDPLPRILQLESYIGAGMKLVSETRANEHHADSHSRTQANWCESRLLMHQSVCAARRTQLDIADKGKALRTAMGILGDAEASLRNSYPRRYRSELAMVELHRAEARLREAESVEVCEWEGKMVSLAGMCRRLERIVPESGWAMRGRDLRETILVSSRLSPAHDELRRARSLVADGLRFLNRAEPVLRDRRRNVWWTTWYFERRMRSIALSVWASVFDVESPIPFLGLEAAPRVTDTIADILLEDSKRMIRADAYRFATVVDAYASCAKALLMRLTLDWTSVPLPRRRVQMIDKLDSALRKLNDILERRQSPLDIPGWVQNAPMDDGVGAYVAKVAEHGAAILKHLRFDENK